MGGQRRWASALIFSPPLYRPTFCHVVYHVNSLGNKLLFLLLLFLRLPKKPNLFGDKREFVIKFVDLERSLPVVLKALGLLHGIQCVSLALVFS